MLSFGCRYYRFCERKPDIPKSEFTLSSAQRAQFFLLPWLEADRVFVTETEENVSVY